MKHKVKKRVRHNVRRIILIISSGLIVMIFGSLGLLTLREKIVYPILDANRLKSDAFVEWIKLQKEKPYTFDTARLPEWKSKTLAFIPPLNLPLEEENVLGDTTGNWIEINLSSQTLCFHETSGAMPCFPVSTGLAWTPTPTGDFNVWTKLPVTVMAGPGYYLPNIHWTMYFYKGYSTHEAYWHNNFGQPMSHGCVNMRIDDAKYIYDRSEVGTLVRIHT